MGRARWVLFVAGTGSGVGKTLVAAALVRRLRALGVLAVGMKPVETGCTYDEEQDLVARDGAVLHQAALRSVPPLVVAPYRFPSAVAPALAAERAGIDLGLDELVEAVDAAHEHGEMVVVEGPAGALAPLTRDGLGLDLAARLGARLVLLAPDALDAPSEVLAVLEAARAREVHVAGVLLSRTRAELAAADALDNAALIAARSGATVLPTLPFFDGDTRARLDAAEAHLAAHGVAEALLAALRPA